MGATIVLAVPVVALGIASLVTSAELLGWITLAAGVVFGGAIAAGGVLLGGRVLDAAGPAVLARLRLVRA
jgi:ABC-2 type transport system permease protein